MKKKILFVMPNLDKGGIQTAFINLINEIKDDPNLDIDVLIFDTDDAQKLPENINLLPASKGLRLLTTNQKTIEKESRLLGIVRLLLGGIARFVVDHYAYSLVFLTEKTLKGYDVAMSFCQSGKSHSLYGGMNEFVMSKVESKKKATVLHCDYPEAGLDTLYNCDLYQLFDKVCAVSEGVRDAFLSCVPECADNTVIMHNCHDFHKMLYLGNKDTVEYDTSVLNILTVARLSQEKGHLRALDALYQLKEDGLRFVWHVVGDGSEAEAIKEKIEDYNMSRNVVLYGNQENPYRFYKNADVLLVPSHHEAAPMVFGEAEFFNLPIVATKTTSTDELVTDRNIGIVCENSTNGIYKAFEYILKNPQTIKQIKNFDREKISNSQALREFYNIIEGA